MRFYFSSRIMIDYVAGFLSALLFYFLVSEISLGFRWPSDSDRVAMASAVMGTAAALLGLVLAASTFLVGHVQHKRFEMLRNAQSWTEFPRLVKSCLWRLFALTIVSGICIVSNAELFGNIAPFLVFLLVISGISVAALVWIMSAIISIQDL